jgi:hypothetical protein
MSVFRSQEMILGAAEGGFSERNLFGAIDTRNLKYIEAAKKARKNSKEPYVDFPSSVRLIKDFQPGGGGKNPKADFLNNLRIEVADRLGLQSDEEMERIGAYTAIGWPEKTPLDIFHGVDAFITYKAPGKDEILVTLDNTENPEKAAAGAKADIVIFGGDLPDPNDDEDGYLGMVEKIADKVVKNILDKMEAAKARRAA